MHLISALLLFTLSVPGAAATTTGGCGSHGAWGGECSIENTGTQIDIGASRGSGGEPGRTDETGGLGRDLVRAPAEPCVPSEEDLCRGNYETAGLPDVTMDDLASFRPAAPMAASEPANVGIAGMPTNFVVAASTHTVSGDLFGYAVTVRFTPVSFAFAHGDGTTARTTTPGATWSALGQAEFTPTATSHAYAARGDYAVTVATTYVAHVDFGGGWRDVPGTLTLTSAAYPVRIVEARTGLVQHTCDEHPSAAGC